MGYFVLTNNPKVREKYGSKIDVKYVPYGMDGILEEASNFVAAGHRLLSHPLSGSVKPGETPYKSMLVGSQSQQDIDSRSAMLISSAFDAYAKFKDKSHAQNAEVLAELQTVDLALIEGAIDSAERSWFC